MRRADQDVVEAVLIDISHTGQRQPEHIPGVFANERHGRILEQWEGLQGLRRARPALLH
jgi:hypothetical protein